MTGCAQSLVQYNCMDDQYDYVEKLYECLCDTYVSVMMSQGDTDMYDQINISSHTVWLVETFLLLCVTSGSTCTSSFYDILVDGVL